MSWECFALHWEQGRSVGWSGSCESVSPFARPWHSFWVASLHFSYGDELLSFLHNPTNASSLCSRQNNTSYSCRDFRRTIAKFCCTAEHPTCLHFQAAVAAIRLVMNKAITSNLSTMHALMVHRVPKFQTYQN